MDNINNVIPKYADIETVGSYLFDTLKIKVEDVLELDHNSNQEKNRYYSETALTLINT